MIAWGVRIHQVDRIDEVGGLDVFERVADVIKIEEIADHDLGAERAEPRRRQRLGNLLRLARVGIRAEPGEKEKVWSETVGPVFQGAWPIDVKLQTPRATFKLVQILLATGPAFPSAADIIIPFIRSESPRDHTSVYSISQASEDLYGAAPDKMLNLLSAVAGDAP